MKEGWEYKKPITDVVWFQEGPGVRNTQYTDTGIKLLNVANLVDGHIDLTNTNRYISIEEAYGKYKHFLVDEGDLILASSGIKVDYIEKKMGFIKKEHLPLCMNTSTIRFKTIDSDRLYIYFFMYFLKSFAFKKQLYKQITGSAQLNFGPSHLKRMTITLPPLSEQQHIVEELDLLSSIIEKKKAQLNELDNLAQSLFYEMFGDPITNEKGWEIGKISNFINVKGGFAFKSQRYTTKGIRLVQIANVWKDSLSWDDITYISEEDAKTNSSFLLKQGDIVMAMTRPIIQSLEAVKVAIVNEHDIPCILNQRVCKFEIRDSIDNIWLYQFLRLPYFKYKIKEFSSKGMQPNVSSREIESIQIFVPPFSLQQQFASKIKAIEHKKELIKQSIKEVETLFNSRMDYYFN